MKVRVYRNLNKKCFSIRSDEGITKGLVIGHADAVELYDVTFKVSEKGRQRVLKTRRKNVHAFICGTLSATQGMVMTENHPQPPEGVVKHTKQHPETHLLPESGALLSFKYNPYRVGYFYVDDGIDSSGETPRLMRSKDPRDRVWLTPIGNFFLKE